ncbi:MAG TPA: ABC transporter substrate-binding protein [Acidimicrobiia bacterium]|nr:ABC transporter substrate-binding protein [Acidimicrobiia bacterium]
MPDSRAAEPIRLGFLLDYISSASEGHERYAQPMELVFDDGMKSRMIDRPVEIVYRDVQGLPRGTVKAVVDAFGELVDEGCLAVLGPHISDNAVAVREEVERRFRVPAMSVCGSEDWLGEWTFLLNNGSMTDEPILWAHLMAKAGQPTAGVLVERSYIGQTYLFNFRRAAQDEGIQIVAEEPIAQTGQDISTAVGTLHRAGASAIVHCGFGLGVAEINDALRALEWDPPRYMGTAFETGLNPDLWDAYLGWIGLEQYDEGNPVAHQFLDRFEAVYGDRPEYYSPILWRDAATVFLHAFADATPLSPRGVKEALERVKMLPAACGSAGTRISFGKWQHRGWMGAGYLVARTLDPDGKELGTFWKSSLVGRYGQD